MLGNSKFNSLGYEKIAEKGGTRVFRKKNQVVKIQEIPDGFFVEGVENVSNSLKEIKDKRLQIIKTFNILPENNDFFSGKAILLETEYLKGTMLDKFCSGKIPRIIKEDIIIKIIEALKKCHDLGFLHGDIKLENIWIKKGLWGYYPILTDFNFFHSETEIFAAPEYLAPETTMSSQYSISSEIWSIGVLTFFILNGHFPVRSRNDGLSITEARNEVLNTDYNNIIGKIEESKFKSFFQISLNPNPNERASDLSELLEVLQK